MKQVKYSIVRYGKSCYYRFSGIGEIDDENLYTSYTDKNGNLVEHTYEDCLRYLHPVLNTENEFKGNFTEFKEIEFENDKGYLTSLEIEVEYQIWIRVLD